eukprot:m.14686 g.14686  ORF g.14686 m.14686 type:complete len:513 (-) comp4355_c0_seq1:2085-3623(-)
MEVYAKENVKLATQPEEPSQGMITGTFMVLVKDSNWTIRWLPTPLEPLVMYKVEFSADAITSVKRSAWKLTFVVNKGETLGPFIFPSSPDELLNILIQQNFIDKSTLAQPEPINLENFMDWRFSDVTRIFHSMVGDSVMNSVGMNQEAYENPQRKRIHSSSAVIRKTEEMELGEFEFVDMKASLPERILCERESPVSMKEWSSLFGKNEVELRRRVFKGGVEEDLKPLCWRFFLDVAMDDVGEQKLRVRYKELMQQWITISEAQLGRNKKLKENFSIIDKDVRRTDRSNKMFEYLQGDGLRAVDHVLKSHCLYDFDLGYTQGMSDLVSVIFSVIQDEALTFWCFAHWMKSIGNNFEIGQPLVVKTIGYVIDLIRFVDPEFFSYLEEKESTHFLFCFRWLLVCFKREFHFDDVKRIWEALWSEYLSSNFSVFICAAMLLQLRDDIINNELEHDSILQCVNDFAYKIDAATILSVAEGIFHQVHDVKHELPVTLFSIVETWEERQAKKERQGNA